MKTIKLLLSGALTAAFGFAAMGDTVIFDNAGLIEGPGVNNPDVLDPVNGQPVGNELTFSPGQIMSSFEFEYYSADNLSTNQALGVELNFYINNGPVVGGYVTPGSLIYSSGWAYNTGGSLFLGQGNAYDILYDSSDLSSLNTGLPNNEMPSAMDVTYTITFTNLGSDVIQLPLAYNTTSGPVVDYGPYWVYSGGNWSQLSTTNGLPDNFIAEITSVPEPSPVGLGVLGGAIIFAARRWVSKPKA